MVNFNNLTSLKCEMYMPYMFIANKENLIIMNYQFLFYVHVKCYSTTIRK